MHKSEFMVLGAGIVGVSTALALQERGHAVVLVDPHGPGTQASYGNAGLIQREAVEPYGFPQDLATLLLAAVGRSNTIHYHFKALPSLVAPLLRYWRHSRPGPYARAVAAHSSLIAHSTEAHAPLIAAAGAGALIGKQGWHQAFRSVNRLAKAVADVQRIRANYGLNCRVLDGEELAAAAPALKQRMAGAVLWEDAWSVSNPGELVRRYARLFERRGGTILREDAHSLRCDGAGWAVGATDVGSSLTSAQVVVAMGAWSDALVRRLGYRFPMFVKRGYHLHYRIKTTLAKPMLDTENGIMLSPMSQGLRVATGAEFARLGASPTPVQMHRSNGIVRELLDLGETVESQPWMGARPCTPDMLPVIGKGHLHRGLWFNFGHAHQGLTLGPATARLLAEQIEGGATYIDHQPFVPQRFAR
nr:glycine oxidase [Variovorax paradoxus]